MKERLAGWNRRIETLRSKPWFRWLLPPLAVTTAVVVHIALAGILGAKSTFPFAFFYLIAVFGTAWVAGPVPGVMAVVITMVGLPSAARAEIHLGKP